MTQTVESSINNEIVPRALTTHSYFDFKPFYCLFYSTWPSPYAKHTHIHTYLNTFVWMCAKNINCIVDLNLVAFTTLFYYNFLELLLPLLKKM